MNVIYKKIHDFTLTEAIKCISSKKLTNVQLRNLLKSSLISVINKTTPCYENVRESLMNNLSEILTKSEINELFNEMKSDGYLDDYLSEYKHLYVKRDYDNLTKNLQQNSFSTKQMIVIDWIAQDFTQDCPYNPLSIERFWEEVIEALLEKSSLKAHSHKAPAKKCNNKVNKMVGNIKKYENSVKNMF